MPAHLLAPTFTGLSIHTDNNLTDLVNQGYTGDWVLNKKKAPLQDKIMVISRINMGEYFIASIVDIKEVNSKGKSKRYQVFFERPLKYQRNTDTLKFNQNPIKYV